MKWFIYLMIVIGILMDGVGIYYTTYAYGNYIYLDSLSVPLILQLYQRNNIWSQIYIYYGLTITMIGFILLKKYQIKYHK